MMIRRRFTTARFGIKKNKRPKVDSQINVLITS